MPFLAFLTAARTVKGIWITFWPNLRHNMVLHRIVIRTFTIHYQKIHYQKSWKGSYIARRPPACNAHPRTIALTLSVGSITVFSQANKYHLQPRASLLRTQVLSWEFPLCLIGSPLSSTEYIINKASVKMTVLPLKGHNCEGCWPLLLFRTSP